MALNSVGLAGTATCEAEINAGERFQFGRNWRRFLTLLDDKRINVAVKSVQSFLQLDTLTGKSFLDIGSGSGLFSLAARRLGAHSVHSIDFDPESVACTMELRRRYYPSDPTWTVELGNALDTSFLAGLGTFDLVYSWGVLHHTGAMWQALENVAPLVSLNGVLYLAIYNDQGGQSARWKAVKQSYNMLPTFLKLPFALAVMLPREAYMALAYTIRCRPLDYVRSWTQYSQTSLRGMSRWHDWLDWVGGYPFEVAKPEDIFRFYRKRSFTLENLSTQGRGLGCNEYLFYKGSGRGSSDSI